MFLAASLLALAQLSGGTRYESERYGFRLELPDAKWASYVEPRPDDALFQVSFYVPDTSYLPSFVVYVAESEGANATTLRDAAVKLLESRGASAIERGESKVAGLDAVWVSAITETAGGLAAAVKCDYVVAHDLAYLFQCGWTPDDDAATRTLDQILESCELFEPVISAGEAAQAKLRVLAERCWEVVDWQTTWSAAEKLAREQDKLVLAVFENMSVLDIPRTEHTGPFFDADFRALVERRFVPLRIGAQTQAPFREPEVFGISEHGFGSAYLFVAADGAVLRETSISEPSVLYGIACEVLGVDPLASDADSDDSAVAHRARAAQLRRARDGAGALEELRAARRKADGPLAIEIDADEAVVLMRLARFVEARAAFERIVEQHAEHARATEALFWLGAVEFLATGELEDAHAWRTLVETRPNEAWAWKAAANLLGEGQLALGGERLDWPEAELVANVHRPARAPLVLERANEAQRQAADYLVATQRENGSWWVPAEGFGYSSDLYTTAISALCATSLIEEAHSAKPRRAVERALEHVLELHQSGALAAGEDLVATYSIWRRTCALWLVARCVEARIGDTHELHAALDELVASVCASQHARGGWPYVTFPGDPTAEQFDPSASFLSAGIVMILLEARDAGANVAEEPLARGLDFIARLRDSDGTFRYMPDSAGGELDGSHPEAGGRGPLCALALKRGKRAEAEMLRETLDLFLRHRASFVSEWHKELCHTGEQGQGSHYLFYDYYFACAAVAELPRKDRARYSDALAADMLAARFADGSFEDMPSLGRAYGTAMALMALRELDRR